MQPRPSGPFPYVPFVDRPSLRWPNGARVAVWVIPNIEYFPLDEKVFFGTGHVPDVLPWSVRDYGARVGIFRIMDVLDRFEVRGTVALNSEVCDAYPQIVEHAMKRDWEIMGHNQSNSRPLHEMSPESERAAVQGTFDRIERATGVRPRGWLSGGLFETWHTLDYLVEAGCSYVCDWVNDDLPYRMEIGGKRLMSIPYSGETNDFGAFLRFGRSAEEFETTLRNAFDCLYAEGETCGRVMAIAVHPYLIGYPHRIGALANALDYIRGHDGVWFATGSEIIDAYLATGAEI